MPKRQTKKHNPISDFQHYGWDNEDPPPVYIIIADSEDGVPIIAENHLLAADYFDQSRVLSDERYPTQEEAQAAAEAIIDSWTTIDFQRAAAKAKLRKSKY